MNQKIASRRIYTKQDDCFVETDVFIGKPFQYGSEMFKCEIEFTTLERYNLIVTGIDEINAIECAISYLNKLMAESINPKFYWEAVD